MKTQIATASRLLDASVQDLYNIIADYRNSHPHILPKGYFLSLEVEEGGFGAGTVVQFQMRLLGQTQSFRSLITEPEPGQVLVETDIKSGIPTSFTVKAVDDHQTRVTISTALKGRNAVEGLIAKVVLQKVYRQELELLEQFLERQRKPAEPPQTNAVGSTTSEQSS